MLPLPLSNEGCSFGGAQDMHYTICFFYFLLIDSLDIDTLYHMCVIRRSIILKTTRLHHLSRSILQSSTRLSSLFPFKVSLSSLSSLLSRAQHALGRACREAPAVAMYHIVAQLRLVIISINSCTSNKSS